MIHNKKNSGGPMVFVWNLVDSQIKHLKPQAKCSHYIGGLMLDAVCATDVDPHTFGLAEPLKEKNNIKTNLAH